MRGEFREQRAAREMAGPRRQRVGLAHGAKVGHQLEGRFVSDPDGVQIGDRQLESGALQQPGGVAQVREGGNPGRRAAGRGRIGGEQALAQLGQRFAAEKACEEEAAGPERALYLGERARKVLGPVQGEIAGNQVEAPGREGQVVLLADGADAPPGAAKRLRRLQADEGLDAAAPAQRARQHPVACADIEREREADGHIVEAVRQPLRHLAKQEIRAGGRSGGAVAVAAKGAPVEELRYHRSPAAPEGNPMNENYSAISAEALHEALEEEDELAIIDFREEGSFAPAHLLHACNVPLSRLELEIRGLVPRVETRIVATDNGEGLAERGAARLREFGYTNVVLFANGVEAWRRAGYEVFSGFNVPSKAFGEYVEHAYDTPSVSAEELRELLDGSDPVVVLDSRPMDEFRNMNIPTGTCCPGAELVYRVHDLAPSPETTVIVNCAGRTRSIIGAQSLINAGIPNRVAALRNGTMGWHLAGLQLERGNERPAPEPSAAGLEAARACAAAVAARFEVPVVREIRPAPERTTYIFDVRHPHEFEAGHLKGSRSAPGGQLVQATDRYAAVRGARIFLVDDNGVRAAMTAHWLRQMNWDAAVLEGALEGGLLETGPAAPDIPGLADVPTVGPEAVEGAVVVDFADSRSYAEGHIPGAWFAIRSRLASARLPDAERYVFTSPDGRLAHLAAGDFDRPVAVLEGGTEAWTGPLESGARHMADTADDVWLKPYEQGGTVEENMQAYLDWETGLVEQLDRDGTTRFWSRPA